MRNLSAIIHRQTLSARPILSGSREVMPIVNSNYAVCVYCNLEMVSEVYLRVVQFVDEICKLLKAGYEFPIRKEGCFIAGATIVFPL